ncbi:carbohydrate-binding protein [Stigmatella sp. ncwal1]|uniref:Carbohydrate-binding protein n=1 Tax=Stigmatella ashevillensis TaxID=2995309 RepID=A0ABT5DDJ4_9BACT|nr:carbohydrate-binding protein [Stigmatella ashevillena]MDC0711114.1 carbohydrate-binding protein [Stigmatella ashevillena]
MGRWLLGTLLAVGAQHPATARAEGPQRCPQRQPAWTNIAPEARITTSSAYTDPQGVTQGGCQAVDGLIGLDGRGEWVSHWEVNPWIQLEWDTARTLHSIDLYDRAHPWPNLNTGILRFSDNTEIDVSGIPTDGALKSITFAPKTVTWVKFEATGGAGNLNGLSEIAAGEAQPLTRSYARSEQVNLVFWPGTRLTSSTPSQVGTRQLHTKFGEDANNYHDFPNGSWLQLDLGAGNVQQIHKVRLRFGTASTVATAYKIWVGPTPDLVNSTLAADVSNNTRQIVTQKFTPIPGRFVRVQVFNAAAGSQPVRVDGLSVYSTDPKPVTRYYPVNERGSGKAKIEPLQGWGWYHAARKAANLLSDDPVTVAPDDRDDSNTQLDLAHEGAAFRVELDDTYALEKMILGLGRIPSTPTALKVELSVDDLHYHTVFDGDLPPGHAPVLTWSTDRGQGDARYVRVTLPKTAAPHHVRVLSRLELYGLPVASPAILPGEEPEGFRPVGTLDVPFDGYLSAAIYSAQGQLVRTLKSREPVARGTDRPLSWNGKDDFGRELPPGPYQWKAAVSRVSSRDDGSVGNTGNPSHGLTHAPYHAAALAYDAEGYLYTASSWEEPEMDLRRYKPNGTPDWAVPGKLNTAVATDGQHVYVAQWKEHDGLMANMIRRHRANDGTPSGFTGTADGTILINPPAANPKPSTQRRATADQSRWYVGINGLAVDATRVWVSNYRMNRVECYDKVSGALHGSFAVSQPVGIAAGADGFLWVAHAGSRVTKFRASMPQDPSWGKPAGGISGLADPYALSLGLGGQRLFLTEQGTGSVLEYNTSQGKRLATHGRKAQPGPMQVDHFRLGHRAGIAVDEQGRYVVADTGNHRLQWFYANGTLRRSMSSEFISAPFVDETGASPHFVLSGPRQYTVDLATGTWQYTHNWTPTDNAFFDEVSKRRRLQVGTHQGTPLYRDFLFYTSDGFRGGVTVYLLEPGDTGMRRAASIGSGWTGAEDNTLPGNRCFRWIDSSADGVVDPLSEVTFPDRCIAGDMNVWVSETGDLWLSQTSPAEGAVVIPLQGFDAHFNPIYDFASRTSVLPLDTSPTSYRAALIRSIPHSKQFLTLGSTAQSNQARGTKGFGHGYVATLHHPDGSEKVRVNLPDEWKAFTIAADGEYWYTGHSRDDQHWVHMYDEDGLLIATMRPGAPSRWGAGWMDHSSSMTARKEPGTHTHYVYAEDVFWGRMIRYATVVNPGDVSRSSGTFTWPAWRAASLRLPRILAQKLPAR